MGEGPGGDVRIRTCGRQEMVLCFGVDIAWFVPYLYTPYIGNGVQ